MLGSISQYSNAKVYHLNDAVIHKSEYYNNQLHVVNLELLQLLAKLVRLIMLMLPISPVPLDLQRLLLLAFYAHIQLLQNYNKICHTKYHINCELHGPEN